MMVDMATTTVDYIILGCIRESSLKVFVYGLIWIIDSNTATSFYAHDHFSIVKLHFEPL